MPIYCYKHPNKKKFIEIIQSVKDVHEFFDDKGIKWERVYSAPNISIDSQTDCFSERSFLEKTSKMKGTVGDLIDYSKELSEKRINKNSKDDIKEKFFKEYSKKRKGKKHPKQLSKEIKKNGITISI